MTPYAYACFIIPLCIIVITLVFYAIIFSRVPKGYEDENGFHYTEKDKSS